MSCFNTKTKLILEIRKWIIATDTVKGLIKKITSTWHKILNHSVYYFMFPLTITTTSTLFLKVKQLYRIYYKALKEYWYEDSI